MAHKEKLRFDLLKYLLEGGGSSTPSSPVSLGPYLPSSSADCTSVTGDSGGTIAWLNPGNAAADDASNSIGLIVPPGSTKSRYLQCLNFGFSIPSTATILGVTVYVEKSSSVVDTGFVQDNIIQLVVGGTNVGTNKADTGTNWTTTPTVFTYGGVHDHWGLPLVPSDFNSTFGCVISGKATGTGNSSCIIDYVKIKVKYRP